MPPAPQFADHLSLFACPVCYGALAMYGDLMNGDLAVDCSACRRRYPIVDGLPVLIASRAIPQTSAE